MLHPDDATILHWRVHIPIEVADNYPMLAKAHKYGYPTSQAKIS